MGSAVLLLAAWAAVNPGDIEQRIFQSVNQARIQRSLPPLEWHQDLAHQARLHSRRMAERRFFSHIDPQRGGMAERIRSDPTLPRYRAAAENLYFAQGSADPAREAVLRWLDSPGHRANLLGGSYRRTGIGVAAGRGGAYYVTQIFLAP